jgi:hypothetical protein
MVTNMRLFAGVSPRMHCQGAALDEALIAILDSAVIGSLIGVDAIVATEIRLAIERLGDPR